MLVAAAVLVAICVESPDTIFGMSAVTLNCLKYASRFRSLAKLFAHSPLSSCRYHLPWRPWLVECSGVCMECAYKIGTSQHPTWLASHSQRFKYCFTAGTVVLADVRRQSRMTNVRL